MRSIRPALLAAALSLTAAAPAPAAEMPEPPCGPLYSDPAGDTASGADNLDITRGWFTADDDGGATAFLQVKNLSDAYPGAKNGIRWRIRFKVDGKGFYVGIFRDWVFAGPTGGGLADPYYEYGTAEGATEEFVGIANGKMFMGENGVIRLKLPAEAKVTENSVISEVQARTESYLTLGLTEQVTQEDKIGEAPSFTVAPCSSLLAVAIVPKAGAAAKASKARKATVGLNAAETVTAVKATLTQGGKTVGTGKLARLSGRGKLVLKLSKGIKKGAATLLLEGRNADGSAGTAKADIRFS